MYGCQRYYTYILTIRRHSLLSSSWSSSFRYKNQLFFPLRRLIDFEFFGFSLSHQSILFCCFLFLSCAINSMVVWIYLIFYEVNFIFHVDRSRFFFFSFLFFLFSFGRSSTYRSMKGKNTHTLKITKLYRQIMRATQMYDHMHTMNTIYAHLWILFLKKHTLSGIASVRNVFGFFCCLFSYYNLCQYHKRTNKK